MHAEAFVTSSIGEPTHLVPFLASDSASAEISHLIFNGLVKYDKDLKLVGDLAERWEVMDGGLKIVFHLRKNVRWQDGAPFTARDVEFTFQKLTDPATPTPYGGDFEKVKFLNVLDDHTLEVIYKEPFSPGLASWSMGIAPKHLSLSSRNPVGTGPYKLKRWKSGELLELVANADYFEGRPGIDRYVYRIIPDTASTFLELSTENLDSASLTPLQFRRQTDTAFFKEKYRKFQFPSPSYTYIGYNLENPLFSDPNVRRAIGLAINKKEIAEATLLGAGRVATGPFLPTSWAHNPDVKESEFDPEKARELLAGRKFSFTLLTNQGQEQRRQACEIIQRRLKDVGIDVKIQVVEWGVFLREFVDKKRFDAVLLAWQLSPEPDIYDIFHSSKTGPGEFNFVSYKSAEVDRLLEEGRRLFDLDERAKVYHRVHEIISRDEPYTFLYVPEALVILHKRFRGVEPAPSGIGHNFIRWQVEEGERKYA